MLKNYRRLPLETLYNARDLGGYPTADGGITKYRQFIRSEAPYDISEKDLEFLKQYGIETSIDFRGDGEVAQFPSALANQPWIRYARQIVFNEQVAKGAVQHTKKKKAGKISAFVHWDKMYIDLLENHRIWVKNTMEMMAESRGAIIFNCTTGKDRTGIMTALLLGLAGVSDLDITADYCVSQIYLKPVYQEIGVFLPGARRDGQVDFRDPFFKTEPESMLKLMQYLIGEYGSILGYLKTCEISDQTVAELYHRLV